MKMIVDQFSEVLLGQRLANKCMRFLLQWKVRVCCFRIRVREEVSAHEGVLDTCTQPANQVLSVTSTMSSNGYPSLPGLFCSTPFLSSFTNYIPLTNHKWDLQMSSPVTGIVSLGTTSWRADGLPAKGADYKAVEIQCFYTMTRKLRLLTEAASENKGVGGNTVKRKRFTLDITFSVQERWRCLPHFSV